MGNPHYWLDPENGKIIAKHILESLSEIDPDNKNIYEGNYQNFVDEIDALIEGWLGEYVSLQGKEMIFYHNSWPYFNERFGLEAVQFIEPKPGIMPSPKHLEKLLGIIEHNSIELIGMETYFSDVAPNFLSNKTGIKVVKLAQSVNAVPEVNSYFKLFEYNLNTIANAFGVE
jgi:ABC-type Zn uptake system ZnuABC Zn-binding protein ZnuA